MSAVGTAAALGSAGCFGIAGAGQFAAVRDTPARGALDPRLLRDLAGSRTWWLTLAIEAAAVVLQVLALRTGPVVVVQAILVLGLPVAVLLAGRAGGRTWLGVFLAATGVAVFASLQHTGSGRPPTALGTALPVAVAVVAALGLLRPQPPVVAGAVAGVITGCASVLLAGAGALPLRLVLIRPPLWAAAAVGVLALQVGQAALRSSGVGPPLAGLTVCEPVAAALLGDLTLHQHVALPPLAVLAAALAVAGVHLLSTAVRCEPHQFPTRRHDVEVRLPCD